MKLIALLIVLTCLSFPVLAADPMEGTGLPVPRFATLKSDNAFVRTGPSMDYPIKWIYKRKDLPVEIVQEYDSWRKIKDPQGETGWVHKLLLSGKRTAIIESKQAVTAYEDDDMDRAIAQIEPGTIIHLEECNKLLCRTDFSSYEGWVEKKSLWGVYDSEVLN